MPDDMDAASRAAGKIDLDALTRTGPGTLGGRYLRRFWQPIWIGEELKPGEAYTVTVMSEELTLYRGQSGAPFVVAGRCAHRSSKLSVGVVDGDCIACLYHGWKYDGTGQCVAQPAEGNENFTRKVKIKSYPTREFLGLIFVYMGEGEPPALPHLPDFEEEIGFLHWAAYRRPCNFFQNVENAVDEAHVNFTHHDTYDVLNFDIPVISAVETDYGMIQYAKRNNGITREQLLLMPNIMVAFDARAAGSGEWSFRAGWRVPIDDHAHANFSVYRSNYSLERQKETQERDRKRAEIMKKLRPDWEVTEDILANRLRLSDPEVKSRPDYFTLQDHVAQCSQGTIVDRGQEWLGRTDSAIILLRKLWMRDLSALAAGQPPHAWRYPDRLPRVSGV